MRMQSWCKTMGAGSWGRWGVGALVGGGGVCVWVGMGCTFLFSPLAFFFVFGFLFVFVRGKQAVAPPCRLGSEARLAGSPIRPRCPALVTCMQQRWEVEPELDTTCWPRMVRCAPHGGG